jgi:hypothetical protein
VAPVSQNAQKPRDHENYLRIPKPSEYLFSTSPKPKRRLASKLTDGRRFIGKSQLRMRPKGENMNYQSHTKQVGSQSSMEEKLQAEGWRTVTFHGWHTPIDDTLAKNKCVVSGCGRISSFHLCRIHAIPGLLGEQGGNNFVFSLWLVERAGQMLLVTLSDFALGTLFGGRQGFENRLGVQGYKIDRVISREEEFATLQQRPGLRTIPWTHDLPERENELPNLK